MINELTMNMVADWVNIEFDLLPEKHVLFQNGIVDKAPAEIESAMRNMREAGERIQIPFFSIETTAWQNVLTPPVLPNTTTEAPATATTYTAVGLTSGDEYGIKVWRRKVIEDSNLMKMIRLWGKDAMQTAGEQLAQDIVRSCFDYDLHMVLRGAIPSANYYDETTLDTLTRAVGARTLEPRVINKAKLLLGDNMNKLKIMICHSKVWADLIDRAYGTYSNATLLSMVDVSSNSPAESVWMANGMIVYVTDRCFNDAANTVNDTYHTYLLAPKQLQLAIHEPYWIETQAKSVFHEQSYIRGNVGYIPHLKGMEYKATAPTKPTSAQLEDVNYWQLGRYPSANMVLAVCLITN
jgi:hypothetical protein